MGTARFGVSPVGARPTHSLRLVVAIAGDRPRDWNRDRTTREFAEILFAVEGA